MSEDPEKTVERLVDKVVEEELDKSEEERAGDLEAEGVDIDSAACSARTAIEGAIAADAEARKLRVGVRSSRADAVTTRSTSGAGYAFEDYIAAWLMVRMLSGAPMLGFDGSAHTIQFQTRALHNVDDLLVCGTNGAGEATSVLISCRSSLEVGAAGFRADFAAAVWKDWDRLDVVLRDRTRFALVMRGGLGGFEKTWTDLQDWLGAGVTALALARIRKSSKHSRVFDSLAGSPPRDDEAVAALAVCVLPLCVDFQTAQSKDEEAAIERCRAVLADGAWSEAQRLWRRLMSVATAARIGSGTVRARDLWAVLRGEFALRDHPDFASAWTALRRVSEECRGRIEIAMPNGHLVSREAEASEVAQLIDDHAICAVHGDSGVGKSALVAHVLESRLDGAHCVWLGSNELTLAMTTSGRNQLGLRQSLEETLKATSRHRNILVIDAAERLNGETMPLLRQLAKALTATAEGQEFPWRIVVVSQTETGAHVREGLGLGGRASFEVGEISAMAVSEALRSSERIGWLAGHADAVAALSNLGALSFVLQAESLFESQGIESAYSKTTIADRIWKWWTGDDAAFGGLLMRLAARDAGFERSFAQSELDPADAMVFARRPSCAPLRLNRFGRIEFVHDMAADWARYRRLREVAENPEKWAPLADNPMWLAALRMLAEVLLRERIGGETGWDFALQRVGKEYIGARDVLLEALALDPLADHYLEAHASLLLADDGVLLRRLAGRFLHVATRANLPQAFEALDPSLSVHFEALHRAPMQVRWPPLMRFLDRNRNQVAKFMSRRVARLCEVWLTGTPQTWADGTPYAFRKEMGELALASVRTLQCAHGIRVILVDNPGPELYRAAFAASPDLPDEIGQWALEMAGRRPVARDVQREVSAHHAREAARHAERMKTDAEYRQRHEDARAMSFGFPEQKLPPWPLGPRRRLERDFRAACLHKGVLNDLMRRRPDLAGEILLACIVEDDAKKGRERGLEPSLGLAFDMDSYPTIYWHSAFMTFLATAEGPALEWLLKLVNFATERWAASGKGRAYHVSLSTNGPHEYAGGPWVFNWVEAESAANGQLYSALAALEFWLCTRLDAKQDTSAAIGKILQQGRSAALLGVLVHVGKHQPVLLRGPLLPLLMSRELHEWDCDRVENGVAGRFNAMHWAKSGEHVFELAKRWAFAPRRTKTFSDVALALAFDDRGLATALRAAAAEWERPDDVKECLELDIRAAQLDVGNYVQNSEGDYEFNAPDDLRRRIKDFENAHAPKRELLTLPMECLYLLKESRPLNGAAAPRLAVFLATEMRDADEDDAASIHAARVAAAGVLLARGRDYMRQHPDVEQQALMLIDGVVAEASEHNDDKPRARFDIGGYDALFAAFAAVGIWAVDPGASSEGRLLRLISSRRAGVIATLLGAARNAEELRDRVEWLEAACHLWAALSALAPRYGDTDRARARWARWVERFRNLGLPMFAGKNMDLVKLSERVDRIAARFAEIDAREQPPRHWRSRTRPYVLGLDNGVLYQVYDRLLDFQRSGGADTADDRATAIMLWRTQARLLQDRADEDGEYPLPDKLGFDLLQALGRMIAFAPASEAGALWRPVLELGVRGHHAADHLLSAWFSQAFHDPDPAHFSTQWRAMAEMMLTAEGWNGDRLWYRSESTLRQVMGFGSDRPLARLAGAPAVVATMWDVYVAWAERHLTRDSDNISAFAFFLAADVCADIRLRGCKLIASRLDEVGYWRRDHVGQSLVELVDAVMSKNREAMRTDQAVRDAVLRILTILAAKGVDHALVLQERVRALK